MPQQIILGYDAPLAVRIAMDQKLKLKAKQRKIAQDSGTEEQICRFLSTRLDHDTYTRLMDLLDFDN